MPRSVALVCVLVLFALACGAIGSSFDQIALDASAADASFAPDSSTTDTPGADGNATTPPDASSDLDSAGSDSTSAQDVEVDTNPALDTGVPPVADSSLPPPPLDSGADVAVDAPSEDTSDGAAVVDDGSVASFTIGGTVTGLAPGATVTLANDGQGDTTLTANGPFTFPAPLPSGSAYAVTVLVQPSTPPQTCTAASASGVVGAANVTTVHVTCATLVTIGGVVTGLATGETVVLRDDGGSNLSLNANGAFTFPAPVPAGQAYSVSVFAQPSTPAEMCVVSGGSGTASGDVSSVVVNCAVGMYTVGGMVSGLAANSTFILQDNGGSNLFATMNGPFTFPTTVATGGTYHVTVLANPAQPVAQTCTVTMGMGTVAGANVTSVKVACVTSAFTVGGTLTGLAAGGAVVLQDNAGDNLPVSANGPFTFATQIPSGGAYSVTVLTEPTNPAQTCTVTMGSGSVASANVTSAQITCAAVYTVGGTLSGLAAGDTVVLQDNGGANLSLTTNGTFTFATSLPTAQAYAVTVLTNPTSPSPETCTVASGNGTIAAANVTAVTVTCAAFTVGGTLTGLAASDTVVLQDNGTDTLSLIANGSFTFATKLATGAAYSVTVLTNPSSPTAETCVVASGGGTVASANVTTVQVTCSGGTPPVLVVGCDSNPDGPSIVADIQSRLTATGAFSTVDVFDACVGTPTVAQLSAYFSVLVWSNNSYANNGTLGDNLADYYDGGGHVVLAAFANADPGSGIDVAGRFGTVSNGYMLIQPTEEASPGGSLGTIEVPGSPLVAGLTTFTGNDAWEGGGATAVNGGTVIAYWTNGNPLIVAGTIMGRNRVDLNMWPPPNTTYSGGWTGQGDILMRNALLYQ